MRKQICTNLVLRTVIVIGLIAIAHQAIACTEAEYYFTAPSQSDPAYKPAQGSGSPASRHAFAQLQKRFEKEQYAGVIKYYQSLQLPLKVRQPERLYEILSRSYASLGQYPQAVRFKDSLIQYKKAILLQNKSEALATVVAQHPVDAAKAQRHKLELQHIEQGLTINQQQRKFLLVTIGIIICMASLALLVSIGLRQSKYQKQLELGVKERKQSLQQKNQQLQAYNKELQAFYLSINHDLVEPLRNIVSFAGLLQRHYRLLPDQQKTETLQRIKQSAGKIHKLVLRLPAVLGVVPEKPTF